MIKPDYNIIQVKVENDYHYLVTAKTAYRFKSKTVLNKEALIKMVKQDLELNNLSLKPYTPAPLENE